MLSGELRALVIRSVRIVTPTPVLRVTEQAQVLEAFTAFVRTALRRAPLARPRSPGMNGPGEGRLVELASGQVTLGELRPFLD